MRGTLIGLLIFLAITAMGGGLVLIIDPSGSIMQATPAVLERTMFSDYFLPGILLFTLFGLGAAIATFLVLKKSRPGYRLAQIGGAGMITWILYQLIAIDDTSFLQLLFGFVGGAMLLLATLILRNMRSSS